MSLGQAHVVDTEMLISGPRVVCHVFDDVWFWQTYSVSLKQGYGTCSGAQKSKAGNLFFGPGPTATSVAYVSCVVCESHKNRFRESGDLFKVEVHAKHRGPNHARAPL